MFSGRCWDLVQVEEWFWKVGRAYCVAAALKVGWVYCMAVLWLDVSCGRGGHVRFES